MLNDVAHVFELPRDPKDAHYVDLAVAANVKLIVSGDKELLALRDNSTSEGQEISNRFRFQSAELTFCGTSCLLTSLCSAILLRQRRCVFQAGIASEASYPGVTTRLVPRPSAGRNGMNSVSAPLSRAAAAAISVGANPRAILPNASAFRLIGARISSTSNREPGSGMDSTLAEPSSLVAPALSRHTT
jgi:hypothetical protein